MPIQHKNPPADQHSADPLASYFIASPSLNHSYPLLPTPPITSGAASA